VGKQKVSIEQNVTFPPMGPVTVRLIDNPDIGELGMIDVLAALAVPGTPQSDVQPVKQSPPPTPTTPPRSTIPLLLQESLKSTLLQAITMPSTKAKVPPPLP
jgi:hypothetical protein